MASTTPTSLSTPTKASAKPVVDSPGTWRHPRLQEITRRQEASTFTEKNARRIIICLVAIFGLVFAHNVLTDRLPSRRNFPHQLYYAVRWLYLALLAVPSFTILLNLLPVIKPKDDLSDIPLTPAQRRLLGLPPASGPPTPGSVYSTPPRYSRTPSISGSAGSRRSISSSPLSNHASPANGSGNGNLGGGGFGSPSSPLLQKAMSGARRSSLGSMGSPSPFGVSTGASFLNGGGQESTSPSPAAGKKSTVGINNKWLYEKGKMRKYSGLYN
ncbi:nuclear pore complex component-domain-containing protein [Xylariomycetidae sp. FL2044]|nr:nuclear pore complex component-domain-containing protein [Xylariomycetidae sp. FL2044]